MRGVSDAQIIVTGQGRVLPGTHSEPIRFQLDGTGVVIQVGTRPMSVNYRDVGTIAVDEGRVLLGIGETRILAEQLGAGLGTLVGALRDRRARQLLTDRLIDLPDQDAIELIEYRSGDEHGVAQLAYHPWGVALMPVDERQPLRLVRRADVTHVVADQAHGQVRIEIAARPGAPDARPIEFLGLGQAAERERGRLDGLRVAAAADAAAIIGGLVPDAPAPDRDRAASLLVDGRPSTPMEVGTAWPLVERAVLADQTYAASYQALKNVAGAGAAWISLAPVRPTDPTRYMAWFFVELPNDLVAFELVSEGSHATYMFRANGSPEAAVHDVSESLIDARFLREPIYMTDAELGQPDNLRYRFAIAALPSLQAARRRFVRRLIHTDEEAWTAALNEAIDTGGA